MSEINVWWFSCVLIRSSRGISKANRSSLSEQNATKKKEATNEFHEASDSRTGETFPQTKVPSIGGKSSSGQVSQDDGRPGQNLVPKPPNEMEVSLNNCVNK